MRPLQSNPVLGDIPAHRYEYPTYSRAIAAMRSPLDFIVSGAGEMDIESSVREPPREVGVIRVEGASPSCAGSATSGAGALPSDVWSDTLGVDAASSAG